MAHFLADGASPHSVTLMIPGQDVESDAHNPLIGHTRELALLTPGSPVLSPALDDDSSSWPAPSDRAPSSPGSSLLSRSQVASQVSMPGQGDDVVLDGPKAAQPPSYSSFSQASSNSSTAATSEKQGQGPPPPPPPSCISPSKTGSMETAGAGRHNEAAAMLEQGQRCSDRCSAPAEAEAAAAAAAAEAAAGLIPDDPAVTSAKASCTQSADADSMVHSREVSSAAEPEWKENGVCVCGRVTKPSPVTGGALAPPLGELVFSWCGRLNLDSLPNEVLMHILSYLEVYDLLATSRTNHHLRTLSLQPILQHHRLRRVRVSLPSLLLSPSRPTLGDLIAKHIFLTHTTQISRRLARSLVAIRLSRRLPLRPSAETLVQRGVLPGECVEGMVAPGLVAKKRAVERERLKDGLRRWVGGVWKGEVRERGEGIRRWEESRGVGRVWKLRRFWERVSRGSDEVR